MPPFLSQDRAVIKFHKSPDQVGVEVAGAVVERLRHFDGHLGVLEVQWNDGRRCRRRRCRHRRRRLTRVCCRRCRR